MKNKMMKLLRVSCIGLVILALTISPGYTDSAGKGKGADNGQGKGREEQFHEDKGQGNPHSENAHSTGSDAASTRSEGQSVSRGSDPEVRRHNMERDRRQSDLRANRPERDNKGRGKDLAKRDQDRGSKKFEHARWSYNPKDERGQGNMGKVDMRDPYGFDKDSGREKSERGRAIKERELAPLDLATLLTIDYNLYDSRFVWLQWLYQYYKSMATKYPHYSYYVAQIESVLATYTPHIAVNLNDSINYTLTLGTQTGYEGTTLIVTTSLIAMTDYDTDVYDWTYNYRTGTWSSTYLYSINYDAEEAIYSETQEVVIGQDSTYTFSYDPATEVVGTNYYAGLYTSLVTTVTEPISGATYSITYDRQLFLYRCPYGRVYDAKSGKAIVGAKVMVLNEDGSIVSLDKASNPTAHNPQTTDATGRFGFKLETNKKYYLKATAPGYQDFKSPIFTEKWHVLREDIPLTPISPLK